MSATERLRLGVFCTWSLTFILALHGSGVIILSASRHFYGAVFVFIMGSLYFHQWLLMRKWVDVARGEGSKQDGE